MGNNIYMRLSAGNARKGRWIVNDPCLVCDDSNYEVKISNVVSNSNFATQQTLNYLALLLPTNFN